MRKYATLTSDVKTVLNPTSSKRLREAKLAFSEFYLNLVLLQNYEQLNSTGFRKICKKHDKVWYVFYFYFHVQNNSSTKRSQNLHLGVF